MRRNCISSQASILSFFTLFASLAPVNKGRTLEAGNTRTAFEVIEDANNDVSNLRGKSLFLSEKSIKHFIVAKPLAFYGFIYALPSTDQLCPS